MNSLKVLVNHNISSVSSTLWRTARVCFHRIDLRNHRKIMVVDNAITYCGSQNCADKEFRVKAKYAPWVDAVVRFEGPIARQNQHLFATDWAVYTGEDIGDTGEQPLENGGWLLHSKTLTLDGDITLIGSANMDRRSFDLNFENNILIYDPQLTQTVRTRQQSYIDSADRVSLEAVESWPLSRRLWNNSIAMLGPIL